MNIGSDIFMFLARGQPMYVKNGNYDSKKNVRTLLFDGNIISQVLNMMWIIVRYKGMYKQNKKQVTFFFLGNI